MPMRSPLILAALAIPLAALGCGSGTGGTGGDGGAGGTGNPAAHPNWAEDVAPVVMKHCANCHIEDGIAPFPLLTYEQVKPMAGLIKAETAARIMPPYNLDNTGECNTFADARWLSDDEIALFAAWSEAGAPQGDPAKAPLPPGPPAGLANKSTTIDMGLTYTPDPGATDEYRCFVVDPGLATDRYLTGYQVHPGDQRVVHHIILFALDTDAAEQEVEGLDAADPGAGYLCFGGPGTPGGRFVAGWAPGGGATLYPKDTGIPLAAGRKLVMQVHYNLANGSFPDRTTIDLALADSVVKEAAITRVAAKNISLPPGQALINVSGQAKVPAAAGEITVWGVAPHMHTRGRTQDAWYDLNGTQTCLSKVEDWNFHWQSFEMFTTPVKLAAGGTLGVTCGYDTSHETTTVTGGEGTDNEMCIDFLYVTK